MTLLPGVRDIRAPLTLGLALLSALWIAKGNEFPSQQDARGALALLYRTVDALGAPVSLGALAFIAHIGGSLLIELAARFWQVVNYIFYHGDIVVHAVLRRTVGSDRADDLMNRLNSTRLRFLMRSSLSSTSGPGVQAAIESAVNALPEEKLKSLTLEAHLAAGEMGVPDPRLGPGVDAMRQGLTAYYIWLLPQETEGLRVRLRVANRDLFDDYDRSRAEAELRGVLVPSSLAIAAAVATWTPWGWSIAAVAPVALLQALKAYRRSAVMLSEAVEHGGVLHPVVHRLQVWGSQRL